MKFEAQPFGYSHDPASPEVQLGQENIRLVVSTFTVKDGQVELEFHATAMFPFDVGLRYHSLAEGLVLVVNDVDQRDGFTLRTYNDFIRFADDRTVNLTSLPALPLPPRGEPKAASYQGAYVNGVVSFQTVPPVQRPSVFLYLVLENYVSNVVGLDLVTGRAVEF
ncbi:hypothetical protein NVS55_36320 [Myxococcus stipitatus]|uniref:hypothetical protein n=1 Tax=Myxococcus stipitatus TaxID=83455 RepID=UPI003144FEFC